MLKGDAAKAVQAATAVFLCEQIHAPANTGLYVDTGLSLLV
jgi:hypothetical protein